MSIHPINSVDIPEYKRQFALRGVICDPCEDAIILRGRTMKDGSVVEILPPQVLVAVQGDGTPILHPWEG